MASSISTLVKLLPHWQHASSTRLQSLDLLELSRKNPGFLDDPNVYDALERGSLDTKSEIAQRDEEIEELELRLGALRQTRSILHSCSEGCSFINVGLKAPIRKLPDDVLAIIFEMVCPHPATILLGDSGEIPGADRHKLASVCHRWRELVFDSSILWTEFRIMCIGQPRSQQSAERQLHSLTELIPRSKLRALCVAMEIYVAGELGTFWSSILGILEPWLAAQCHSITSSGNLPFHADLPWCRLYSLRIGANMDNHDLTFTAHLPVLQNLRLDACPSSPKFELGINWHTLTRLDIGYWEIQQMQHILPQCVNLEELEISAIQRDSVSEGQHIQVSRAQRTLPRLRTLSLNTDNSALGSVHVDLFRTLHIPSLRSLRLRSARLHNMPFLQTLTYCPLISLTIAIRPKDLLTLPTLLESYPTLESLCLSVETQTYWTLDGTGVGSWQSVDALLHALEANPEADATLLPRLSALVFLIDISYYELGPREGCCKALVDMARSRLKPPHGVSRLQKLFLLQEWSRLKPLKELKEQGMTLVFR